MGGHLWWQLVAQDICSRLITGPVVNAYKFTLSPVRHVGQFSRAPLKSKVPSGLQVIENVDFVRSDSQNIVATPFVLF